MDTAAFRVLLLEDTDGDRMVIEEFLRTSQDPRFSVEHFDHVAHLERRLQRHPRPDLLILDLCVHDSEGIETFQRVHRLASSVPTIIQSGLTDRELAATAVRNGAQDYLVKGTFDASTLLRTLRYAQERHAADEALRASEQRYALAVSGANDGLWDWDLRSNTIYFAPRWTEMLGFDPDTFGNTPDRWFSLVHPDERDGLARAIAEHSEGKTRHLEYEHRIRHADGHYLWVLCRGVAARDGDGAACRMAGSQTDVTARKRNEQRLLHDAFHDKLTGLANRSLCLDRIEQAMRRARRSGVSFAVLFVDLDRFKLINDSLGHSAGDKLLVDIAERLRNVVRPADTVARLGGDEFCIVLETVDNCPDAERVAERAQRALALPLLLDGREVFTSASIGIALFSDEHRRPSDMIRAADLAMYSAKARGKACTDVFDGALQLQAVHRLELETDLRLAIERSEFLLHYQPIVTLETGDMSGVEALIRWNSPSRGLVPPLEFIPLAEETGLILPIGAWVFQEAMCRMAEWDRIALPGQTNLDLSVNVSTRQFFSCDLVRLVGDALFDSGMDPARLVIEITESVLLENSASAIGMINELRGLGIKIHLDDFGTGFSSLSYLQRLPIDRIKIDRSFIRGISERREDLEIVRAIVALGHGLGKGVVAEGIETPAQLACLRDLGCDFGQGFLFSRPVPRYAELRLCA